ncbi:hypothetical protein FNV43_RR17185 [Rhamnella rubrinervis]|uniref:Uncharacterized protein n=1 Tax=Rhamnella rubrinervis TaxID=2594499 RepID=A0A8K0GXT3_9ROSA|nr:hypothetical protein FNV43_RR17185 [Rhamnella rubrinervis]
MRKGNFGIKRRQDRDKELRLHGDFEGTEKREHEVAVESVIGSKLKRQNRRQSEVHKAHNCLAFALTGKVEREGWQESESLKEKTMREIVLEAIVI